MTQSLLLNILLSDDFEDLEKLELSTMRLLGQLKEFPVESAVRIRELRPPLGTKGDAITLGALTIAVAPIVIPQIFNFIQNWRGPDRRVRVEGPNGIAIEFTAKHQYSEEEILQLAERLSAIAADGRGENKN